VLLLENPNILKVGRMVHADLKYLETAVRPSTNPFCGAVDLAMLAKERQIVSTAKCSLADLSAAVLQRRLSKNVSQRISTSWEDDILTPEMLAYAALDAYTSLTIYQQLIQIPAPSPLPSKVSPHLHVILYHNNYSCIIARGHISETCTASSFDGINITDTRTVIEVTEVVVPAAIISTHHKQPLSSFGSPPFQLVCLRSHLKCAEQLAAPNSEQVQQTPLYQDSEADSERNQKPGVDSFLESNPDPIPNPEMVEDVSGGPSLSQLIFDHTSTNEPMGQLEHERDPQSAVDGERILGQAPSAWKTVRSRVINDPFHLFHRFYISTTHGLRIEFARALRDALFVPDQEDKQRISAWAATLKPPMTFDALVQQRASWVWQRCKRVIPPPEILYPLFEKVLHVYGSLKDAKTGATLFNSAAWHAGKNILSLIHDGGVSDPPDVPLYSVIGLDAKNGGLPLYRCARGTTFTEGGVHTHLRSRLPSSGASSEHVCACLLDFIIRHNLLVRLITPKWHTLTH